ncbi:MAG: HAMP domain-containing histidine kinase [Bacteroidales bacterium]|nr:HAMP domain-containing histidine kinase [Bacteroidales bacterium]
MKLLTKTSLIILTISIIVVYAGNLIFFHISKQMIEDHIDNELTNQMHKLPAFLEQSDSKQDYILLDYEVEKEPLKKSATIEPTFLDTVLYDAEKDKYLPYRAIKFSHSVNNENHKITIFKSLLSSDKLVKRFATVSIAAVAFIVLLIYMMNQYVFEKIWSPFFKNLRKVENYDIKNDEKLQLESSEIEEFEKLNKVHTEMVERIQKDFTNLKDLTASTSHELQTPLAVIKGKAELLLQSNHLSEEDLNTANTILNTTKRLAQLNQSLLLISRIENNQYEERVEVDFNEVLNRVTQNYEALFDAGQYQLTLDINPLKVWMNQVLADVLISNLLKNALMHGRKGGEISISIKNGVFTICNPGEPLSMPKEDLFKRFAKGSGDKNSTGLGLEIVQEICNYYKIPITYDYKTKLHCFSLDFNSLSIKTINN